MAFSNGYTVGFAVAICVVCSTALAGVSLGLKDRQEANARRDLCKNILQAVGLPEDGEPIHGEAVDKLWAEKVELKAVDPKTGADIDAKLADLDKNGTFDHEDLKLANERVKNTDNPPEVLGLFIRKDNGVVAVPMDGKGLWGPISGYVAFDPKMTTVKGTTFFAPKETPGLGAEIQADKFENSMVGKSVYDGKATKPIRVLKAAECDEANDNYCVDGVAGATITSRGVDDMIEESLAMYEPYLQRVRGNSK